MEPFLMFIYNVEIVVFFDYHVYERLYSITSCAELGSFNTGKRNETGKIREDDLGNRMVGLVFDGAGHAYGLAVRILFQSDSSGYFPLVFDKRSAGTELGPMKGNYAIAPGNLHIFRKPGSQTQGLKIFYRKCEVYNARTVGWGQ